jgi:lysophospholipase L1-like esterase
MSSLPNVLLLGDSIRMSYQPNVSDLLAGHATVTGPSDNCQYSLFTLSSLDRWINDLGKPDIVHWNNGLHDCGHNPGRNPIQIPVDMYGANLSFILGRLKFLTPNVIWATNTPVHSDRPFSDSQWSWRNDEIDAYNSAARQIMDGGNVHINDLHTLVKSNVSTYLSEDQLHLSAEGQAACARAVAEQVSAFI